MLRHMRVGVAAIIAAIMLGATASAQTPTPHPRAIDVPAKWLDQLGVDRLISGK